MSIRQLTKHSAIKIYQDLKVTKIWRAVGRRCNYTFTDSSEAIVGYAVEAQKGLFEPVLEAFQGSSRYFEIHFFDKEHRLLFVAVHPIRFSFSCLELREPAGSLIGSIERRFSIFYSGFDVKDENGGVLMRVRMPFYRIWSFDFVKNGKVLASLKRPWPGLSMKAPLAAEFELEFKDGALLEKERRLVLAATFYVYCHFYGMSLGASAIARKD